MRKRGKERGVRDQEDWRKERDHNREREIEKGRDREGEIGRREIEREKRDRELVFMTARTRDTRWLRSGSGGVLNDSEIVFVS